MKDINIDDIYKNSIEKVNDIEFIMLIMNCHNNLFRFNVIQRMQILSQLKSAVDVRTTDEWESVGISVNYKHKPILITDVAYSTSYIIKDTKKEFNESDLTMDEKLKAIELGLIEKDTSNSDTMVTKYYDYRQTYKEKESSYVINKPLISAESVALSCVTVCDRLKALEHDNKTHIDYNKLTLCIGDESNKIELISNEISKYFVKADLYGIINNIGEKSLLNNNFARLVYKLTKFGIDTVVNNGVSTVKFSKDEFFNSSNTMYAIIIADQFVYKFVRSCEFTDSSMISSAHDSTELINKSKNILTLMEANMANRRMNGK